MGVNYLAFLSLLCIIGGSVFLGLQYGMNTGIGVCLLAYGLMPYGDRR